MENENIEPECSDEDGHAYQRLETDSRQEWTEHIDTCKYCSLVRTRRIEYKTQSDLVESDKYYYSTKRRACCKESIEKWCIQIDEELERRKKK